MQCRFIATVEALTGRRVRAFISNHHVGPDLEIELLCSHRKFRRPSVDGA